MAERPIEDLERELRERALTRDADLVVRTESDGRVRAAFMVSSAPLARHGAVLQDVTAGDKRVALEGLLVLARGDV